MPTQQPSSRPAWTPFVRRNDEGLAGGVLYENIRCLVWKRHCGTGELGTLWHLSIRNRENTAEHNWRNYQRIKNELAGPEAEAVELYPAESRLVDTANQFHLCCIESSAGQAFRFPFGFGERLVWSGPMDGIEGMVQRPFERSSDDHPE